MAKNRSYKHGVLQLINFVMIVGKNCLDHENHTKRFETTKVQSKTCLLYTEIGYVLGMTARMTRTLTNKLLI